MMLLSHRLGSKAMSNLSLDIIVYILSRLPDKSLGKFKSVCKSWNSLISSPHFVKLQHNRAISGADLDNHFRLFMYMNPCYSLDYESPSSFEDVDGSLIVDLDKITGGYNEKNVGSCYGLIYFVCYQDCIILWNPCTKHTRKLPNPNPNPNPNPPSSSSDAKIYYGLGYDSCTGGYKMVRVICLDSCNYSKVEVFNIQTSSSWRAIAAFDDDVTILDLLGTFANGAIHWKATRGVGPDKYEMILSLDIREEKFAEISLPDVGDRYNYLGDLKGSLCLQVGGVDDREDGNDLEIWVMNEYGVVASWTRLVTFNRHAFDCSYSLSLVCFMKNGDAILNLDGWHLVRFDTLEKTTRYHNKRNDDWFDCFTYVESLVSPHGDNMVDQHHESQV